MVKNLYSRKPESPGGDTHSEQQGRVALRWGKVVELAPEYCQVRIENRELDQGVSYWLSVLYPKTGKDKWYWMPELDEYCWFLWDEQGEEGIVLGAFYNAEVPLSALHPPNPHKTEVHWGDQSYVFYNREEHHLDLEIKGSIAVKAKDGPLEVESTEGLTIKAETISASACETIETESKETVVKACDLIVLEAPEIVIKGSLKVEGGAGGFFSFLGGGGMFANGLSLVGIGAEIATPAGVGSILSSGLGSFSGGALAGPDCPDCPEPVEAEEVDVELQGDLGRLHGYTPPGWGTA